MLLHPEIQAATPQQRKRLQELDRQLAAVMETLRSTREAINAATVEGDEEKIVELQEKTTQALRDSAALFSEKNTLSETIIDNYIKSFNGNKDSILQAAKKLLKSVTRADFIERSDREANLHNKQVEADGPRQQTKRVFPKTYTGAKRFLTAHLYLLFEALKEAGPNEEPLHGLIEQKIKEWGFKAEDDPALLFTDGEYRSADPEEDTEQLVKQLRTQEDLENLRAVSEPAFYAMVHGKGTDALAPMIRKKPTRITGAGRATIVFDGVEMTLSNYQTKTGPLSVSTDKLFRVALAHFTKNNHIGAAKRVLQQTAVYIPFLEYANQCGYDVLPRAGETPQETAKRTKNPRKKAREKIKKDLNTLYNGSLEWKQADPKKKKEESYYSTRIIEGQGVIEDDFIVINFAPTFANYLIQQPIMQFPAALLGIDERNPNAYNIGLKIAAYYSNDTNYKAGRNEVLKVRTLLAVCSLPDIETVKQQRNSWTRYIKDPFENALTVLMDCGFLSAWAYRGTTDFKNYHEWESSTIQYSLKTPIDPTHRLARKEEIIEARTKAKQEREDQADKKRGG